MSEEKDIVSPAFLIEKKNTTLHHLNLNFSFSLLQNEDQRDYLISPFTASESAWNRYYR